MFMRPHFVRDYRRLVRTLKRAHTLDDAMERAVGGNYEAVGSAQLELLRRHGLRDSDALVDVGCGSGRTAYALRSIKALRYHGTDVVPDLIVYARQKVGRSDWRFSVVDGLSIPETDNWADLVTMFSVLTHLTPAEGFRYVTDAVRVVKPGGSIIASFVDSKYAPHAVVAGSWSRQFVGRVRGTTVKNVTLSSDQIQSWADKLSLRARFFTTENGQSHCVLTKTT